jgi:hypothetical protein
MHGEEMCRPHAKELYGYIVTEDLLESRCQLVVFASRGFVELVRERDLFMVVLGEQTHLFAWPVSKVDSSLCLAVVTLCSIPASARAVYAPRENPVNIR